MMPNNNDIKIHPTAHVEDGAILGPGTVVGAYTTISRMTRIGADTKIGSFCEIGIESGVLPFEPLSIGERSIIRSGTTIYSSSTFGPQLITGHKATLREGINAGENLQVGTLSDIQGHCVIGNYVRCHSNVHIGQRSKIGNFVWIFPYVVLTNDPYPPSDVLDGCVVSDFAVIATMSTVLPGKKIGSGALVGAMTLVREDVPSETICVGVPGRNVGSTSKIKFKDTGLPVYPWRRHFRRGYPEHIVQAWINEFK